MVAKLILLWFVVLLVLPAFAQTLTISPSVIRGTGAIAYGAGINPYYQGASTYALGSFQSTFQGDDSGVGSKSGSNVVAYAYADLNSDVTLSANVLSVIGTGNCDTSQTANNGIDPQSTETEAQSSIQVNFSIDSPFYYSIQSEYTSGGQGQVYSSVQLSVYPGATTTYSGSGILPPGSYELFAGAEMQTVGDAESLHSQFGVMLIVFPTNVPSTTTTVSRQQYKAAGCGCSCPYPVVGDPIRIGTGNLFEQVSDYSSKGQNPFTFTRYYNSLGDTNTHAVSLGNNWRSTYDRYLRITSGTVISERADGQELMFTNNNGSWASDTDVDIQLLQSGSSMTLIDHDDTVETYNSNGSLNSIVARDGYTQTLSYNDSNQLVSITDSFNRRLQLTYQNNLIYTVTAPNGLILTYGYSSSGVTPGTLDRLASVTYSTTPASSQSYLYENSSLPFSMTGIIDEDGNRFATWTYDSIGRANSSQHAGGADLTTISYNGDGSCSVMNALGLTQVYRFTILQGVPKLTEVDRLATATTPAATRNYTYDGTGYIANISDWNNNTTSFVKDIHDRPLRLYEAAGTVQERTTTSSYLSNFHLPLVTTAPNKTTLHTYDSNGNLLIRTETDTSTGTVPYSTRGQTRSWRNTFDTLGHLLTTVDPRTDISATNVFTYDTSNNVSTITDPLGHVTRLTNYNGSGLPLTDVDANGVTNQFTYDILDRLLSRTVLAASGNATTTFGYDAAEQLTSITLPDNSRLNYQYDAAHRLVSVSNLLGESITYTLDSAGNITQQINHNAAGVITKTQSQVFDGLNRLLQSIGAAGQTTTYGYDNVGNRVAMLDGLTNYTARAFDPLNRLVSIVDPLTNTTGLGYDAQDNNNTVTDPRSLVTTYVYDGFGHVIQETSPDKGTTVYLLDKAGNRTNEVDSRGIVTVRTFDKLNRVVSKAFPASPSENITYSYDATNAGNFGVGHLTGYTDETGSTSLKYNERGDVIAVTRNNGGAVFTTTYDYDLADNVTNIVYPSGHVISYARDSMGRISSVLYQPSVSGTTTTLASSVSYAPFGPLTGLVYGNGLARTNVYDKDYRVTGIATVGSSTQVQNLAYGYNPVNNIIAITDNLAAGNNQTFAYDSDYRLTQAVGNYGLETYAYDADGNRVAHVVSGIAETFNYVTNANLLISTVKSGVIRSFSYTANGNMSGDDRASSTNLAFGYGNRNRYNTLTAGSTTLATYSYNALGERLTKTVGSTTTVYHYDQNHRLIAESLSNGTLIREYVWLNDMPLAQIEGSGSIYYVHPDHLNRPQKMTDVNQKFVWDSELQPFGETGVGFYLTSGGYNANKHFQIQIGGLATYNCVVEASTNLSNWIALSTNTGPFTFDDASTANNTTRFYRVLYGPTSAVVGTITNNLRFPGQYYDAESGLNYNMMRDYDPTLGRYIQHDPIRFHGGIGFYSYVANNSVNLQDPYGLDSYRINSNPGLGKTWLGGEPGLDSTPTPNPISHTFIAITQNGTVVLTYSWLNTDNGDGTQGAWALNRPEDICAAKAAIANNVGAWHIGGETFDTAVEEAFGEIGSEEGGYNLFFNNCKEQVQHLIDRANQIIESEGGTP